MIIVDLLPCEAVQTPMAALSSGRSAPRPLTAQTKPPSGHAALQVPPRSHHKDICVLGIAMVFYLFIYRNLSINKSKRKEL